jgi:hypothetical protein
MRNDGRGNPTSATTAAFLGLAVRRRRDNRQRPRSEMARYFSAGLPSAANVSVINLVIDGNNGSATVETGESADPFWRCAFPATADGSGRTGARHAGAGWANISAAPALARAGLSRSRASLPSSGCSPALRSGLKGRSKRKLLGPRHRALPRAASASDLRCARPGQLDFSHASQSGLLLLLEDI